MSAQRWVKSKGSLLESPELGVGEAKAGSLLRCGKVRRVGWELHPHLPCGEPLDPSTREAEAGAWLQAQVLTGLQSVTDKQQTSRKIPHHAQRLKDSRG